MSTSSVTTLPIENKKSLYFFTYPRSLISLFERLRRKRGEDNYENIYSLNYHTIEICRRLSQKQQKDPTSEYLSPSFVSDASRSTELVHIYFFISDYPARIKWCMWHRINHSGTTWCSITLTR